MTKKLLSLLVAALMVLTLLPAAAFAKTTVRTEIDRVEGVELGRREKRTLSGVEAAKAPTKDDVVLTNLLLEENWDGDSLNNEGWWMYNADGNSFTYNGSTSYNNWVWSGGLGDMAYSGDNGMISYSWIGSTARNQDNWLCTPDLAIPATGYFLSYYARSANANYMDHLQIMVGVYGTAYDDETITTSAWDSVVDLYQVPAEYSQMLVDLSAYAGQTISIAFRHVDYDEVAVILDDVAVGLGDSSSIVNDTGVTISDATAALGLTEGKQLTAAVVPADATFQDITWSTSDSSIVAVNNIGGIIAMGVGTATVTATSHSGYTATCTVTVSEGDYEFMDDYMMAYTIFDVDNGAETNNLYGMDRFGTATLDSSVGQDILVSEYCFDGKLYGYVGGNTDSSGSYTDYKFVSIDIANDNAVTVIAEGLAVMPEWMAYNYEDDVMYGAFYYEDSSETTHFDIAELDLTTGLEGTLIKDIYNEPYDDSSNWELTPTLGTYYGNGMFLIYYANMVVLMVPDYDGSLALGYVADDQATIRDQIGTVANYYQKMWFNPFDGMLYWATIFGTNCTMVVTDLESGISVATGVTGVSGASSGMEVTGLFVPYVAPTTHTVTFVDGLTNEPITTVEVEDGAAATAPDAPVHEGYTFTGWDVDFSNVTADLTVTAQYTINQYLVTFVDGLTGEIIFKDHVNHGAAATAPDAPVHEGYTFTGWDVDFSNITADLTVTAQYQQNGPSVTLLGDVDLDGEVTATDALLAMRHAMSIITVEGQGFVNGDMDGDGAITASDAILIMRAVMAI